MTKQVKQDAALKIEKAAAAMYLAAMDLLDAYQGGDISSLVMKNSALGNRSTAA